MDYVMTYPNAKNALDGEAIEVSSREDRSVLLAYDVAFAKFMKNKRKGDKKHA